MTAVAAGDTEQHTHSNSVNTCRPWGGGRAQPPPPPPGWVLPRRGRPVPRRLVSRGRRQPGAGSTHTPVVTKMSPDTTPGGQNRPCLRPT